MFTNFDDRAELQLFISAARHKATEVLAPATYRQLDRLQTLLTGIRARLRRWHDRRIAAAALAQMDERLLRDIGLTRDAFHYAGRSAGGAPVRPGADEAAPLADPIGPVQEPAPDCPAPDCPAPDCNDNRACPRAA